MSFPPVPPQLRNFSGNWFSICYNFLVALVNALSGGPAWQIVDITPADSPYTAKPGQWVNCDTTTGAITVIVPSKLQAGSVVFKDSGEGPPNAVTIEADHGNISGAGTQSLTVQYSALTMLGQGPAVGVYVQS